MPSAQTVREVVEQVFLSDCSERENAIALHDYIRENVRFGFNKHFDAAEPDYTLACGYGHCNAKSRLMVSLFRAIGIEAHQHFVVIPKDILDGAFPPSRSWMIPPEICHSYVEVRVGNTWCEIDSFVVDTALLKAAQARLAKEGRSLGYGVRASATNVWDGQSNAFSQFDQGMMIEDHGRVDDLETYFRTRKYRHKFLGLRFNTLMKLLGSFSGAATNSHIDGIRMSFVG